MEDLFVPFEIALEMKLLKFDKPCCKYVYTGDTGNNCNRFEEVLPSKAKNYNAEDLCVSQPTFAQCFKFFREKHGIKTYVYEVLEEKFVFVTYTNPLDYKMSSTYHPTYEQAELACVTELINIVKNKKP